MHDSVEVGMREAIKEVEAGTAVRDDDAVSPVVKEDTTAAKSDEAITLSATESEGTMLIAKVEEPLKKKGRKRVLEDLSSTPQESPSLVAQPQPVPPSRSISPEPKLWKSKNDDPKPGRKKKKRRKRDEIDDLFAGL
ncbi:hypothetical protein C7212DRAFT_171470 [Tuber magnatum]|uniref:Uncharacterized protein n=1 Tax=Tuber magnatum TaxID=42249 RepID=A0A317T4Q1_9PEZI|nr:hypothetical protein C7212DRAFT_171470 [Tuber magnatum]